MVLGDSLTAGFYAGGSKFAPPAATLQKLLDKECGKGKHTVQASSSCGETAVSMAKRKVIDPQFAKRDPPRVVVILGGTNDLRAWPVISVDEILEALATLAAAAAAGGAAPLLLTVPRMPASEGRAAALTARRLELNGRLRDDERFATADVARAFEDAGDLFDADGLHLTPRGYATLAAEVFPALRAAQKTKRKPRTYLRTRTRPSAGSSTMSAMALRMPLSSSLFAGVSLRRFLLSADSTTSFCRCASRSGRSSATTTPRS